MPHKRVFNCDDLKAAMELTNFGTQRQIADLLGVSNQAVSTAMRTRCQGEIANYLERRKRVQYRAKKKQRKIPTTQPDCVRYIGLLREHRAFTRAAKEIGTTDSVLRGKFFGQKTAKGFTKAPCAQYAEEALTLTRRAGPKFAPRSKRDPIAMECGQYLTALQRAGSFPAAAKRLKMQESQLRFTFFGRGGKTRGRCAEYREQAEVYTRGRGRRRLPESALPPPPRQKKPTFKAEKPPKKEIPVLASCEDLMESFHLNDGSFRAMGREFGMDSNTIKNFMRVNCEKYHPEMRAAFAHRKMRGRRPTFLDGFFGFLGFN